MVVPPASSSSRPDAGVHVAHEVVHLLERLGRRRDHDVDAVAELVELEVGDEGRDLDEGVVLEGEPGHLAVDPDDAVVDGAVGGVLRHPHHPMATRGHAPRVAGRCCTSLPVMTWGQEPAVTTLPARRGPATTPAGAARRAGVRRWLLAGVIVIGFALAAVVLAVYYGATLGRA